MKSILSKALLVLACLTLPLEAYEIKTGSDKFANISYPATSCDINLEEGTIETWVRIDFDPAFNKLTPNTIFYMPMTYFNVGIYGKSLLLNLISRCSYDTRTQETKQSLYLNGDMIGSTIAVPNEQLNWEKGQWHYLAVTWKNLGKKIKYQLYVDGVVMSENEAEPKKAVFLPEGSNIEIGSHYFNCSYGAIDSFRVSSVVRTREEIQAAFGTKTLNWDRFYVIGQI